MSSDAKLHLNPIKWEPQDIVDIIHTIVQKIFGPTELPEIKMGAVGYGNHFFMNYKLDKGPGQLMIHRSSVGGIPSIMISGSSNREKKKQLLRTIGKTYGGVYTEDDCTDMWETFDDPFEENQEFTLKQIQKAGRSYATHAFDHNKEIDEFIGDLVQLKKSESTDAED